MGLAAFLVGLCVTPLVFPALWFADLGPAAWLMPVAAALFGLVGVGVAWPAGDLLAKRRRRPGGPPALDRLYAAFLAAVLMVGTASNLNGLVRAVASVSATATPLAYVAAVLVLPAVWCAAYGPEPVLRAAEVTFPVVAVGLLGVYLAPITNVDALNVPGPVLPSQASVSAATALSAFSVRAFLPVLVLGPMVRDRVRARRWSFAAVTVASVLVLTAVLLSEGVFGPTFAATLRFPFVSASDSVYWEWLPITSAQVGFSLMWETVSFGVAALYAVMTATAVRWALPGLSWRWAFLPAVAGLVAAMVDTPQSVFEASLALFDGGIALAGLVLPALYLLADRGVRAVAPARAAP
jgi:hypothetical protein